MKPSVKVVLLKHFGPYANYEGDGNKNVKQNNGSVLLLCIFTHFLAIPWKLRTA